MLAACIKEMAPIPPQIDVAGQPIAVFLQSCKVFGINFVVLLDLMAQVLASPPTALTLTIRYHTTTGNCARPRHYSI
jgi:hypothetical protein